MSDKNAVPPKNEVAELIRDIMKEAIPQVAAVTAEALKQTRNAPTEAAPKKALPTHLGACQVCRQKRMACKGKHRMAVVMPADEDLVQWFTGVKINGVNYLSPPDGRAIPVPAESNIEHIVQVWTQNEREQVRGRQRSRHSGSIGAQGTGVRPVGPSDYIR